MTVLSLSSMELQDSRSAIRPSKHNLPGQTIPTHRGGRLGDDGRDEMPPGRRAFDLRHDGKWRGWRGSTYAAAESILLDLTEGNGVSKKLAGAEKRGSSKWQTRVSCKDQKGARREQVTRVESWWLS